MSRWSVWVLLALSGGGLMSTATAQWAWRDQAKDNQITFSDRPPPADVAEKDIIKRPNQLPVSLAPKPPPSASEVALSKPRLVDAKLEAKRKEAETKAASLKKLEADKIAASNLENCERTRNHLKALASGVRITNTNAMGEQEPMDDDSRRKEMSRTRNTLSIHCK